MKVECGRTIDEPNVMRCAIWYHLYNLKNLKNTHEGVLLLVKLQAKNLQFYQKKHSSMGVFHAFKIVQMIPNCQKHHK